MAGASNKMATIEKRTFPLYASLHGETHIALTRQKQLIFSNENLVILGNGGIKLPLMLPFVKRPLSCILAVSTMLKIKNLYLEENKSISNLEILMQASLEATCCYLNHHPMAAELLGKESGFVSFVFDSCLIGFLGRKNPNELWEYQEPTKSDNASVIMTFKDMKTAYRGALGEIDPYVDPAEKNVLIEGRIPLIEKIGFISRITLREVPTPRKSQHAV